MKFLVAFLWLQIISGKPPDHIKKKNHADTVWPRKDMIENRKEPIIYTLMLPYPIAINLKALSQSKIAITFLVPLFLLFCFLVDVFYIGFTLV